MTAFIYRPDGQWAIGEGGIRMAGPARHVHVGKQTFALRYDQWPLFRALVPLGARVRCEDEEGILVSNDPDDTHIPPFITAGGMPVDDVVKYAPFDNPLTTAADVTMLDYMINGAWMTWEQVKKRIETQPP